MRRLRVVVIGVVIMLVTAPVSGQSTTRVPFDYTAGGLIPAANCVQAFDPWAIQGLAQSYVDLGPHGNDAIVTVPPTLSELGWVFNGVDQFVDTRILPASPWTVAISFHDVVYGSLAVLFGTNDFMYYPRRLNGQISFFYGNTNFYSGSPIQNGSAIVAVEYSSEYEVNTAEIFIDGASRAYDGCDTPDVANTVLIGRGLTTYQACSVARFAQYNIRLSAVQAAALSAEMAEYNEIEMPPSSPTLLDGFAPANIFTTASDVFNALWSVIAIVAGIALGFGVLSMILARLRR